MWPECLHNSAWIIAGEFDWNTEFACSDILADSINKAIEEAVEPSGHITYNTVEEFINSLKNR
jgi:hypothetical protein